MDLIRHIGARKAMVLVAGAAAALCALAASPSATNHVTAARVIPEDVRLPAVSRGEVSQPPTGVRGDEHLDKTPPRKTVGLDLVRNGWSYNCMECHKLLPARWHYGNGQAQVVAGESPGVLNEHKSIQLDHGNNRFCLNCHHSTNRNAFADYDGSEIAQTDVVELCAKCHGTTHRDWKAGVHGRQNGYWNVALGERTRLNCIQCHDPHSPKFKPMQPLPPLRYPERGARPPTAQAGETQHH